MITMAKYNDNTTIQLSKKMRDELKALGAKGETYDDIIKRLIKAYTSK